MKKVVVFGDLPIATKIVIFLEKLDDISITAVIGNLNPHNNDPWKDVPVLADYVKEHCIRTISLNELIQEDDNSYDLGLSCRFSKIIKAEVITKFKHGIINMHGGLIPEFGGLYSANHTILEGSSIGGGTLHYIDAGIDTGPIIKRCVFPVTNEDTGFTVFQRTQIELERGMEDVIPQAMCGVLPTVSRDELIGQGLADRYFDKRSLEGKKEIKMEDINTPYADRVIRAFDFPGYEPAYFVDLYGKKTYLRKTF